MINPQTFFEVLKKNGVEFFTGVPDSLLKDFCAYIVDNTTESNHIIAANEGASVGLAIGHHLATGKLPLVYMQNSGLGNAINPLLSIADEMVYSIPMLLVIGWRGEPNVKDEPQHVKQGAVNESLLESIQIPYSIIDKHSDITLVTCGAIEKINKYKKPYVLLVKNDTFEKYTLKKEVSTSFPLNREGAIKLIIDKLRKNDIVVSTTGKTSREVFEYRKEKKHGHESDFLTVGAMGHTSSIAIGIAKEKANCNIYCIDGDGSVIMHMGSLAINGMMKDVENFKHIVINNGSHDSVGGQPTVGFHINMAEIAKSCGYTYTASVESIDDVINELKLISEHKGRCFLEIKVNKGARENLGRPSLLPIDNKNAFQNFLSK